MSRRRRLAVIWIVMAGVALASLPFAREMVGRYHPGGLIVIRPWMQIFNVGVSAGHGVLLIILGWAIWRGLNPGRWRRTAVALAVLAAGSALATPLAAILWGVGPWSQGAVQVHVLGLLVFAPAILRGGAWGIAALESGGAPLLRGAALLMIGTDLLLCGWALHQTAFAVTARLHPLAHQPLSMVPFAIGSVLFARLWWAATPTPRRAGGRGRGRGGRADPG